ncbi:MFS-type transporter SLC18B1-like isoform X1 [Leptotrombidium deliense]|uniref:MFS-type transporter SLC18B1-like isoform X1 n=1 Tax=Leptotrombidium deliense TaxID=299467 RepID=A0A443SC84_9ACAR|nr:MFS-type transporter SLC18B1-like isoform X1 [Leptotrombidium deliense]
MRNVFELQAYLYIVVFVSTSTFSLLAPFFPHEAATKGMPASITGYVFSSYGVTLTLVNFILPNFMKSIGEKNLLIFGILLNGLSNICFGFVIYVNNYELFVIVCFACRIVEGIGIACIQTTVYYFVSGNNQALGYLEACITLGSLLGFVFGAVFFETFELNMSEMKTGNSENSENQRVTYKKLLLMPEIIFMAIAVILCYVNLTLFEPFMETFLMSRGVTHIWISVVFISISAAFFLTAVIIGQKLSENNSVYIVIIGSIIASLSYFISDTSLIYAYNFRVSFVAFSFIGVSSAMIVLPTMMIMLNSVKEQGYDECTARPFISGIRVAAGAFG